MIFCRSMYVKKVMTLLAFIFEQPSYTMFLDGFMLSKKKKKWGTYWLLCGSNPCCFFPHSTQQSVDFDQIFIDTFLGGGK